MRSDLRNPNNMNINQLLEKHLTYAKRKGKARYKRVEDMMCDVLYLFEKGYSEQAVSHIAATMVAFPPEIAEQSIVWEFNLTSPSFSMDQAAERNHKRHIDYSEMPSLREKVVPQHQSQIKQRYEERSKLKTDPENKKYQRNLKHLLNIIKETGCLPGKPRDLFVQPKPQIVNIMMEAMPHLFGITDGCLASEIRDVPISDPTWLSAIELALTSSGMQAENIVDMDVLEEEEFTELANTIAPSVISFGLLIHTIRVLSSDAMLKKLYEDEFDKDKTSRERKALYSEIMDLKATVNSLRRKNAELQQINKTTKRQNTATSNTDKQISALVHQHNNELKEKDQEIQKLRRRIERMETDLMEAGHSAMVADEKSMANRPWLDLNLPENNVLFVGGHPNMKKKLQEKFRGWHFLVPENSKTNLPVNPEAIFVWSGHLSHSLWDRIDDFYQGRKKIIYIQSTNFSRLEEEMKHGLWQLRSQNT